MPLFAHVRTPPIPCPTCGADLVQYGEIGFQWGHCCHPFGAGGVDYEIGDEIHWRCAADGSVPVWTYFASGGSANIGDPAYNNLVILESELDSNSCSHCSFSGGGIGLEIVNGKITSVTIRDDISEDVEITIVNPDGSHGPMPDIDRPMPFGVRGGRGPRKLIPQSAIFGDSSGHPT